MNFPYKIGVIGTGNMGTALIRGLLCAKKVRPSQIIGSNRSLKKLIACRRRFQIETTRSNQMVLEKAQTIVLAIKPQDSALLFPKLKPHFKKSHLVISMITGVDTQKMKKELGKNIPFVRVSPNLPSLIGCGIAGIYSTRNVSSFQKRWAHQIFEAVGETVDCPNEKWLDAVTGLSGTGPAYVFALIEALIKAGKKVGLPAAMVKKLTLETVSGAAKMALKAKLSPEELRAKVTSKKGTTWMAMKVFKKFRFWDLMVEAVRAATKRARELRGK